MFSAREVFSDLVRKELLSPEWADLLLQLPGSQGGFGESRGELEVRVGPAVFAIFSFLSRSSERGGISPLDHRPCEETGIWRAGWNSSFPRPPERWAMGAGFCPIRKPIDSFATWFPGF